MIDLLFIQPKFPGQYRHIIRFLAQSGEYRIVFLASQSMSVDDPMEGVTVIQYVTEEIPSGMMMSATDSVRSIQRAEAILLCLQQLKGQGFNPSTIACHGSYGEFYFLKLVYPNARHVYFMEYYFRLSSPLFTFDTMYNPVSETAKKAALTRSSIIQTGLEQCDIAVCPTNWQHSHFPKVWQSKIRVIHDGINTEQIRPKTIKDFQIGNITLDQSTRLLTYCARSLEPVRGIYPFIEALPDIQAAYPNLQVIIVGKDISVYGLPPKEGKSHFHNAIMSRKDRLDLSRIHHISWMRRDDLTRLFQRSDCHVYMTYPFVLSWSMLEAMAAGCLVVGSNTEPVREVITHGHNGYLTPFFDSQKLSQTVIHALSDRHQALRDEAVQTVRNRYSLAHCLPQHLRVLGLD